MTILRQRMTEDMQVRNLSPHTQASYLQQVSLFARYFRTSPNALTRKHIRTYQISFGQKKTHLTAFSCGLLMIITQEPAQSVAALDAPLSIEVTVPRK